VIRFLLVLFAAVILFLLAVKVLDSSQFQWQSGALAALAASFLPFTEPWGGPGTHHPT
jgi:hypothetical protein